MMETTRFFWLTGLAGAGKSTIAKELRDILIARGESVVLLDGDELREALQMTGRYSLEDREWLAWTYARLGSLIASQGLDVICATISPFPGVRVWLRKNVSGYVEVHVRTTTETVFQRDQKALYSRSSRGEIKNVVGHDIPFVAPESPEVVIDNEPGSSPAKHAQWLADFGRVVSC